MKPLAVPIMCCATTLVASAEGRTVETERVRIAEGLRRTHTLGQAALRTELGLLADACRQRGWDGYSAAPMDEASLELAKRLLDAIPPAARGVALSVSADPDGQVSLEWHRSPRWTLAVSVSPRRELHYSALLGPSRAYGTEPLDPSVGLPERVRSLIRRIESA